MNGPTRRLALAGLVLLGTTPSATIAGQAFVRLGIGGTMSTTLVGEVIENPISEKQSMSPTGTALIGWSFRQGYRLGIEGRYASGTLEVHDDGSAGTDELGGLATLQLGLVVDGPLRGAFRWEATVGMLRYMPEQAIGAFRDGNPTPLLVGGGLAWHHALGHDLRLIVAGRYDYHAFHTTRLQGQGYSGTQAVHRGALTLGLERGF
ncbi:MAG TPA: hypothetical protein VFN22_01235 [Gemmatimonadales bacterium]|nr:hypothetical protein [Gemmatimonadales bacterium]